MGSRWDLGWGDFGFPISGFSERPLELGEGNSSSLNGDPLGLGLEELRFPHLKS